MPALKTKSAPPPQSGGGSYRPGAGRKRIAVDDGFMSALGRAYVDAPVGERYAALVIVPDIGPAMIIFNKLVEVVIARHTKP